MVDLVKIRKKAKKQQEARREDAALRPAAAAPPPEPASAPVREAAVEPEPVPVPMSPPAVPPPAAPAEVPATPLSSKLEQFKEMAGRMREGEGLRAEHEGEEAQEGRLELLTFLLAGEQYAVDIERIVEIVTPRPVTRIPNSDASVVGIISLRGTIVTLVDVRRKLRHRQDRPDDAETRLVVVDYRNETVGFIVDRVLRVVKALPDEIEPHPVVHATELDEAVRGVFRPGGALTILLDLDKLLGGAEQKAESRKQK